MPDYVLKAGGRQFKITSEHPLSADEQRAYALKYLQEVMPRREMPPETREAVEREEERRTTTPEQRRQRLIREELARPQITPPGLMSGLMEGVPSTPEDPGGRFLLGQMLGIGGPLAGATIGSTLGPGGTVAGEVAGSYGARRLSKFLGLEEAGTPVAPEYLGSTDLGDLASVGLPLAARGVMAVGKRLPGVSAVQHEMGAAEAKTLPGMIRPATPSDVLYQRIGQANPVIPTPQLQQRVDDLLARQGLKAEKLQNPTMRGIFESLREQIRANNGQLPFQNLWADLKAVGEKIGKARAEGGEGYGELRQLYKAIFEDMEAAATAPGQSNAAVRMLKEANAAARKEFAAEDLGEIIARSVNEARQGDALVSVNGSQMLKRFQTELRHDDLFRGSFSADELDRIEQTFKDLAKLPQLPPPRGAAAGSMKALGTGGLAGAGAAALGLGPTGVAIASGAGSALPWVLGTALTTNTGRSLVRGLIKSGTLLTPAGFAALTGALRTTGQLTADELTPP